MPPFTLSANETKETLKCFSKFRFLSVYIIHAMKKKMEERLEQRRQEEYVLLAFTSCASVREAVLVIGVVAVMKLVPII